MSARANRPSSRRTRMTTVVRSAGNDRRYWRYMTVAMDILGVDLHDLANERRFCAAFVRAHSGRCALGDELISHYRARHHDHVTGVMPHLFPETLATIQNVQVTTDV